MLAFLHDTRFVAEYEKGRMIAKNIRKAYRALFMDYGKRKEREEAIGGSGNNERQLDGSWTHDPTHGCPCARSTV
jgi:hypothetical protein